jgi:hypothetical protein
MRSLRNLFKVVKKDEIVAKALELARHYPLSLWGGIRHRKLFEDVETYFMFIGYPRSGHGLIGSLLDAHPSMVVANELNTLKYLYAGFRKNQICYLLLQSSQSFAEAGAKWSGYSYRVPYQWQGRFKKLQILGDRKGGSSALILSLYPSLLERLRNTFGIPVKFIHVTRNPYDNISTICRKHDMNLMESIDYYFSLCEAVTDISKRLNSDELFEFSHESFIHDPENRLKEICAFLGVNGSEDYLSDCADIVFTSPHKTRDNVQWNKRLMDMVEERIAQFPFLNGYSFED